MNAMPIGSTDMIFLEDDTILLRKYSHCDDLDMYACWQDTETQKGYNFICKETFEEFRKFDIDRFPFWAAIVEKGKNVNIGTVRLGPVGECPDLAIWIYQEHRNLGYGTRAFTLALQYCFAAFNLKCISAGCYQDNEKSIKMLQHIGFVRYPQYDTFETSAFTGEPVKQLEFRITSETFQAGLNKRMGP
jgi:RimJ/RimL family protein N-acetyltransferase